MHEEIFSLIIDIYLWHYRFFGGHYAKPLSKGG
jgi:hypothetical protein